MEPFPSSPLPVLSRCCVICQQVEVMDIDAEREKLSKEIKELERILDPSSSGIPVDVSESSLESDSDGESLPAEDLDIASPPVLAKERWDGTRNDEEDPKDKALPEDPETCLQLNMVYQEVIQEKLAEVSLLLAQNREQQEEILWGLSGSQGPRVKDGKGLPPHMYIGHFMKPYFKDKVTGVGPPANEDTREKAAQGIKAFEQLLVTKWKHWEKALLRRSVVSDRLQRLLQPKLLKLEYLRQKQSRISSEPERQALEEQARCAEQEIQDINQLPEEALLGNRMDSHDWEKISKVNFEGARSAEEIQKFWQSSEHPSINKQEWSTEEVEQLMAIAAAHGHLHWQLVAEELGTGRSAFQCLQKFQQHNKALKRREWTEEEDRMLTQLVQQMRVGSHVPYRRIVYYMEGRDSMQLIYRWTKSLDPNLKKGLWAPDEDAKLLRAVAKYGEQDWFKIREEVPGRSDAQCRDRYLRRLHVSLKKGRWNAEEEEQLIELIEKHGVGHWAKIASELPHRSGSQCLSKWKIMAGKKQRVRRRRPRPRVQWSSSSSSGGGSSSSGSGSGSSGDSDGGPSSSSSEDSEGELEEPQQAGSMPPSPQYVVPNMDLWVPARQSATQKPEAARTALAPRVEIRQAQGSSRVYGTHAADTQLTSLEEPSCEGEQHLLKVPLETVRRVLRTNTTAWRHKLKERLRQPPLPGSPPGPGPGDSEAGPHLRQLWRGTFRNRHQHHRRILHRRLLEHRLLLAMTPWVGDVTLPCTQAPQRPVVARTRADGVRTQLEQVRLASTPVFTLCLQLLQIDTAGCMEVVRERKAQLPPPGPQPRPLQVPSGAPAPPGCQPQHVSSQDATKSLCSGSTELKSSQAKSTSARAPAPAPQGPRPRPKTVSQLLREKRLHEAPARKATLGPVALAPQLLISPVVLQQPLPPARQGPPAAGPVRSSPGLSGPMTPTAAGTNASGSQQEVGASAKAQCPPTLQALQLAPTLGSGQAPTGCPSSSLGQSQAPATMRKQGLPEAPAFLPAAPSPALLPTQPLSLTPTLATSIPLPVSWVLTAQGLLPVQVPAVLGLPTQREMLNPPKMPTLLPPSPTMTPVPPHHDSQPPATVDTEAAPESRTDPSGPPTCCTPLSSTEVSGEEAQVARQAPVPRTSIPADSPDTGASKLPACGGPSPSSDLGGTEVPSRPLGLERSSLPGSEKRALDLGLLCLESEAATWEWVRGRQGVCVPPLQTRLPYQPPALCSLRTLSSLLLRRAALEHKAASLVADRAAGPGAWRASLELVRRQLQDNPAYLLLKARFLAVFTLPALLATLPPSGVPTTVSAAPRPSPETTDEDFSSELESEDGDRHEWLGCTAHGTQAGPEPGSPVQGAPDSGKGSVSCLDASDLDVLRTRHGRHVRKRRRQL
ncbi:PREDICTED: snRNA-activating protein complex subunit 4 isoform X1 [Chinchilla lanigera]|nr:PREDICTED: snRNA-activating protein complex subunit 4 isoform X1 [Chinchilla lanigera]XP_013362099.1 PREDICTED: snRNA-activating protein complex subunit 4 isoform X1 [Chinchilla lanigera]XP_013362100.1 PREDICTED: snRNA-activating protein complex subunit 4 isoform X1 [Chinchilla lanigera]XP_013362101.1 PREDICTED: snRNA-activating protein complex subunit 4 isoform X1 [Chinchilla lanigera]